MISLEDDSELSSIFESERRRHLLQCALDELRTRTRSSDRTIRAFEMVTSPADAGHRGRRTTRDVGARRPTSPRVGLRKNLRVILEDLDSAFDDEDLG